MPASERSFGGTSPERLYVDSGFFVTYLSSAEELHERVRRFLRRLAEEGRTQLFLSSLLWLEILQVIRRDRFRSSLPNSVRTQFQLDRWEAESVRLVYVNAMLRSVEAVLDRFQWFEIGLTPAIRASAMEYAMRYNLGAYDAVHIASAMQAGVPDIASFDRAFRRVDEIALWNDLVHAADNG